MAYIKDVQIGSDTYLIEPTLYIAPSKNGAAYTASLANFSLVTGATVQAKFAATNDANATLNVNGTGAKEIHYNDAKITANQFKANHVYTLVYDGTQWQVSGDIDTNTWRGIQDNLTSDSTTDSLSAKQGKVLKGLIDAMDASTPAASGNATAFIDSITQTDGKITSITKKTIPAASTSTAGIVKIGTTANDAAAGNHNHDSTYSYIHLTDYDFTDTRPLSKYVTFDKSRPVGAPKEEWYNGFISSHSNYHASYIINGHTNQNEWYVGHGIWREANTPHAPAPTWYLLAHSGNVDTGDNNGQVKIAGVNVSVKGLKALAYKDSLVASDIPDIGDAYLKLSGGTMTGDIEGNASVALGTTTNPFHHIVLGGTTNATLTADSTNPRITFQESNNGTQPVHLIYSDYDNYRSPAGLKIIGGTSASPAWLEVEGDVYAAAFKGHADSATSANYLYPFSDGTNVSGTTNIQILQTIQNADNTPRGVPFGVKLQHGNTEVGFGYFYPKAAQYGGWYIASYGGPSYVAVTNGTWETYKILISKNTAAGTNNAATLAWNTTYTIAKINGTDIKFTTMAKPSYAFTDLTEHPTTLSGYGITDAAANNHSHTLTIGNKSLSVSTSEQEWNVHDILYNENIIYQSTSWDIITPGIYAVGDSSHDGSGHPGSTSGQTAPYSYGHLIVTRAGSYGAAQIYISHVASGSKAANKGIRYRSGWNVNNTDKTEAERWQAWATILDDKNFNLYAPTLTGAGASGSWGISVTGTAANVTGTVAIAHGGTGATTASAAANALISELPVWTATPTADTYFIRRDTTGAAAFGQVKFSSIANITNNTLRLGPYSSTLVTSVNGNIGDVTITAADLGLHTPLSFVGVVAVNSAYQPSDGTQGTPTIVGMQEYTPASGDVILDKDSLREYVYANDVWTLLGYTASQIYDSNNIAVGLAPEDVPTWISRVTQATDGSIQVERKTIGVLPIAHGGTGASSFSANAVIISTSPSAGETMTLTSRAYSDSTSAEALVSTSTNFVTERDIYFGLPQINNLHNYTSDNGIYAPTTSGEQYQLLVSDDTGNAPIWTVAATVQSEVSTTADVAAYTTLTLGNSINVTAATAHSEGQIQLYSAATHAHIIKGTSTNTLDYTHILPNSDGVLVQTSSAGAVGGPTQPVYVNADNTITALTFTQNRLYYSASDSSFTATNHYASATQIGLGTITLPENNSDTLYVNGTTYFVGNVKHNGFAYFANGTTYYIDDTGDARLKNLGIGNAAVSASYALNIEGDTYINGTHFFGNGTDYFIDDYAVGFFPDLRVDKIQLDDDMIKFYSADNAGGLNGSLYASIQGTQDYMHFLLSNGTVDTTPTFDFNGHLLPSTDEVGDLGSSTNRWAHLYLGTDDTYGDSYTPIYWNDGVPTEVTLVQQCAFTINSGKSGVRLTHTAITIDSYVTQIVVTSGEANLNSAISWTSADGYIELTCTSTVSGNVTGYIMISRGGEITATATDIT